MTQDNGYCPACGRPDAVKERPSVIASGLRLFECGGCKAQWAGVRPEPRAVRRAT